MLKIYVLKIYVLLAALPDPGVPGFQFARSPPATAPRDRARPTRFPGVRWSADFRHARPPIVRG
jgi:hypothetical protein